MVSGCVVRACALVGAALCGTASAHVVIDPPTATAGGSMRAAFRVGHGCGESPTRQVIVEIPPGARAARPMPKPGWQLQITREKLAVPYESHGRPVTEDVVRVAWVARTAADALPHGQFDEFVLMVQLPAQPGPLYWPVRQLCELGQHEWIEIPTAGRARKDLQSPAPLVDLAPARPAPGHAH